MRFLLIVTALTLCAGLGMANPIWDAEWAKTAPLDVEILSETEATQGIPLIVRELTYFSHEWNGTKIRIAGHLAFPKSASPSKPRPAMILVTGDMNQAKAAAGQANIAVLSIDRVGEGKSTGPKDDYRNWLDLDEGKDIRNSWMYHYVLSAIRAVTYLQSLDVVGGSGVGVSGISRGGLCSLLAASADDRITLAMPIAATGDFARTVTYPGNWLESLVIHPTGRTVESTAWKRFVEAYDPLRYAEQIRGTVWVVTGAQDEFFPVTSTAALMARLNDKARLELLYDADHGYFGQDSGLLDSYNNGVELWGRIFADFSKAIGSVLPGTRPLPASPKLDAEWNGEKATFRVVLDAADATTTAQIIYSVDGAYTFKRLPLTKGEDGVWTAEAEVGKDSLAAFAEAKYSDGGLPYYLTSTPYLSDNFKPKIRPSAPLMERAAK